MALLTTWGADNRVITAGKTKRITTEPIGSPATTVQKQTDGSYTADTVQYYKVVGNFTARYSYVGMDLETALSCADAMRSQFTRQKQVWEYGLTKVGDSFRFKWENKGTGTVLEAEVCVEPMGGRMWQVSVNADCTDEKFVTNPLDTTMPWPQCFNDVI